MMNNQGIGRNGILSALVNVPESATWLSLSACHFAEVERGHSSAKLASVGNVRAKSVAGAARTRCSLFATDAGPDHKSVRCRPTRAG